MSWTRKKILFTGIDLLLYSSIVVVLFLSFIGKLPFEFGYFNCNDTSIRLEKRPSSVGLMPLLIFYFLLPLIAIFISEAFYSFENQEGNAKLKLLTSLKKVHHLYVRYFLWATLNILLNDMTKIIVAVPRPHFIETCIPDWQNINCSHNSGFIQFRRSLCLSNKTAAVYDSMKSWPSGHAQLAAFAATFLMVYLEFQMKDENCLVLKRWLQSVLLIFPIYSSASRIHDYKHHVSDVVWGVIFGCAMAMIFLWKTQLYQQCSQYSDEYQVKTRGVKPSNEKQKRPSRMQLIQSEFGAIEEMESEIVQQRGGDNSHNNHVFNHLQQ